MEDKFYGVFYDTQYNSKNWKAKIKFLLYDTRPSFLPNDKLYYTIGRFEDPETAAKAYDAFVREHNLANSVNFDEQGNRIKHKSRSLSEEEYNTIRRYSPFMSTDLLSQHMSISKDTIKTVNKQKHSALQTRKLAKETPVIILTTEEIFKETFK